MDMDGERDLNNSSIQSTQAAPELESISQLLDNLQSKLNLATKRSLTYEQVTTWNSKLLDVQRAVDIIQNAFVPVNQLPIEIMHHILDIVLNSTPSRGRASRGRIGTLWGVSPRSKCLLELTAVCQRWRHLAIANTLFWSDIDITFHGIETSNPDGMFAIASEFLVRSRPAPVRVRIMTSGPTSSTIDSWIVEKLSNEFYRLEKFGANIGADSITYETLYFPAPNLKTLYIWCDKPEFPVLPPIFNSYFPNLQKLRFKCFSSLPAGRFTNLTSLSLQWQCNGEMSGIEFLDVLQASPSLEYLSVHHHGPIGKDVCSGRRIHLPCLKSLTLEGCNFEFILTHVFSPQMRKVYLFDSLFYIASLPEWELRTKDVLIGIPQEFLHELIPKVIDSLSVQYNADELNVEVQHSQLFLKINQHLYYDMDEETLEEAFPFVRRSLTVIANTQPLTSISLLSIRGCDFHRDKDIFSEELWDSWFSRLGRLERLELRRILIKDSCMALLKENPEGNLPCAKLQLLELEIYQPSIEDLDLISELVMGRFTKGLPLKDIKAIAINSELEKEGWENLWKQYVEEVDLDIFMLESDETSSVASDPSDLSAPSSFESSSSSE